MSATVQADSSWGAQTHLGHTTYHLFSAQMGDQGVPSAHTGGLPWAGAAAQPLGSPMEGGTRGHPTSSVSVCGVNSHGSQQRLPGICLPTPSLLRSTITSLRTYWSWVRLLEEFK